MQAGDDPQLQSLLSLAHATAKAGRRPVLLSSIEPAAGLDPLTVLGTLASRSASDPALAMLFEEGSMYWLRGSDGFSIAGLGAVATIHSSGRERFDVADTAWAELLKDAVVGDRSNGATGAGPTLMGGFAFEPDGPRSEPWQGFPGAHLIVPRLHVSSSNGRTWVTISMMVGPEGEPEVDSEALLKLRQLALGVPEAADTGPTTDSFAAELAFEDKPTAAHWRATVGAALDAIKGGTLEKVVLARAVHAESANEIDPYATLRQLRKAHRNAFIFGYWRGANAFVGASPERLIRLDGRSVQATSLAGTAKRGATPDEDARVIAGLLASAKDRAEHAFVLMALEEVLSEFCDGVTASPDRSMLTMPNVHHLQTEIRAQLSPGNSLLKIVARLHPTPAVGGSPRDAALRLIREMEELDRGWYAGPIGWIGRESGEFAVALRSAILYGTEAMLFAGCGIVADSDPELELAESVLKLEPMKSAIAGALATSAFASATVAADRA